MASNCVAPVEHSEHPLSSAECTAPSLAQPLPDHGFVWSKQIAMMLFIVTDNSLKNVIQFKSRDTANSIAFIRNEGE